MKELSIIALTALITFAVAHTNLDVRPGENITLSCVNISRDQTQAEWFRVVNGTDASCVSSMLGSENPPSYCSGFTNGRFGMSLNKSRVFLTIRGVRLSDSGLYFCGFFMTSNIVIGNTTSLKVTGDPTKPLKNTEFQHERRFSDRFLPVIVLGSLSVMLLIVVVVVAAQNCKLKKAAKELQEETHMIPSEDVNYAALKVKVAKLPGQPTPHRPMETHVIYSCTK